MGFSQDVRERAYIASARRCCVCKKFAGRNIEVHHIIQKADGGEDSFDNAVPLCFDCHAEAGHYNPHHPKGAKYSPSELRSHRDSWYRVVADGINHVEPVPITHQYFITNSFDIVSEIVNGKLNNFPIDQIKLVQNELFQFLKSACKFQKGRDREVGIGSRSYASIEEFLSDNGDAKTCDTGFCRGYWERTITREEVEQRLVPIDFVANYMLKHGARPSDISKVVLTEHGCGDQDFFFEEYIMRTAKVVFLVIINTTNETIHCRSLLGRIETTNSFAVVGSTSGKENEFNLNDIPLMPGESLLVPSCIVLTPFEFDSYTPEEPIIYEYVDTGEAQDTRGVAISQFGDYPTIGPYHQLSSFHFLSGGTNCCAAFRPLLMNRLFMISRSWECGSCPHLFIQNENSEEWLYHGELFSRRPDVTETYLIDRQLPQYKSVKRIKILELENETTFIDQIVVDGQMLFTNVMLRTDEEIGFDVSAYGVIKITGHYALHPDVTYRNSQQIKMQKVYHTLIDMNQHRRKDASGADLSCVDEAALLSNAT